MTDQFDTLREAAIAMRSVEEQIKNLWRTATGIGIVSLAVCGFFYNKLDAVSESAERASNSIALSAKELEKGIIVATSKIDARLASTETKLDVSLMAIKDILAENGRRSTLEAAQIRTEIQSLQIALRGVATLGDAPRRGGPTSTGATEPLKPTSR